MPFSSKADVREDIEGVLGEIEDADVRVSLHSTMLRADVRLDDAAIQVEVSVAPACQSAAMATGGFALSLGQPSHVVRVMEWGAALAHKLAAWNERRLLRDLYDVYFLAARVGASPDFAVLDERLAKVRSRLPSLRRKRSMSRGELASALREAAEGLGEDAITAELAPLLPAIELSGLVPRLRASIVGLVEGLGEQG